MVGYSCYEKKTHLGDLCRPVCMCRGERGTVCHGAHFVSGVYSIAIQFRYVVAL